ncbi:MAG: hypothetical protein EXR27_18780 [Betaproteobacteria bacterium]|nr:hypothetical protein [Betaproteobacteria bacterium]
MTQGSTLEIVIRQTIIITALGLGLFDVGLAAQPSTSSKSDATLTGFCEVVQTPDKSADNPNAHLTHEPHGLSFTEVLEKYRQDVGARASAWLGDAKIKRVVFVEFPKQGSLEGGVYRPNPGYRGADQLAALVEVNGKKVKVEIRLVTVGHKVYAGEPGSYLGKSNEYKLANDCELRSKVRRISEIGSESPLYGMFDGHSQRAINAIGGFLGSTVVSSVSFASLDGRAIASTTGEFSTAQIALDSTAAGHGWFIDETPLSNEEFLPTANPNEWVAKAGSARSPAPLIFRRATRF